MDTGASQQLNRILDLPRNVLNDTQMEAGTIYMGHNTRTRRIVSKMLAGEPILLGVPLGPDPLGRMPTTGYHYVMSLHRGALWKCIASLMFSPLGEDSIAFESRVMVSVARDAPGGGCTWGTWVW